MRKIEMAAKCYAARKARKEHPDGTFDSGGRWDPSASERQKCCESIRGPSRKWPYSLMLHCRTAKHIANLYGVKESDLKHELGLDKAPTFDRRKKTIVYKAVACKGGKFLSIFDGETRYELGKTMRAKKVGRNHNGGFYAYKTAIEAAQATVPGESALRDEKRVILKCEAWGQRTKYSEGKTAYAKIKPVSVIWGE